MERLRIQQEELERCSTLQEQLHSALNEIETLKQQNPSLEMRYLEHSIPSILFVTHPISL